MEKIRFRTGNVVKTNCGDIVIITGNSTNNKDNPYVKWVSFSYSNMSGGTTKDNVRSLKHCDCGGDEECEYCAGTKSYEVEILGYDSWVLLADNCEDYIKQCLMKNFDFD